MEKELMKSKELAEYLGVTMQTLRNWRKEGMPSKKAGYKLVFFDLNEVMEWLENR